MQKTKIEWTDYTSNCIKGLCPEGCPYCYARALYHRFKWNPEIRFSDKELKEIYKLKIPNNPKWRKSWIQEAFPDRFLIFIGSTIESFGDYIEQRWLNDIFHAINDKKPHIFQILTKKPTQLYNWNLPDNLWIGTTITNDFDWWNSYLIKKLPRNNIKFVSFEPLHSKITIPLKGIDWIIIGAETGNRKGKIVPKREWIEGLINQAKEHNIPIFLKDNLKEHWDGEWYQEFPK